MGVNRSFLRQLSMVIIVCLGTIIAGCMNGWSAPALVKLQSGHDIFNISSAEGSALILYAEIGHFIVPLPGGLLADIFGRKPMFVITSTLALIGWSILTFGDSLFHFIVARIFLGFGFGLQCVLMTIYIAEISSKNVRGTFGSTSMFSLNVGVLLQFVFGGIFSLRLTNAITLGLCIVQIILVFFVVESPYFLLASQRDKNAEQNLMWLRAADSQQLSEEFSSIAKRVKVRQSPLSAVKILFSRDNYKGFMLCMIISFLSDLSGRVAVLTYASESFRSAGPSSTKLMTILLGVFNVLFPIIPILLSDRVGRKVIIIVSTVGAIFMHLVSGCIFLVLVKMDETLPWLQWILFVSVTGYLSCNSIFATSILTLRGEIISENCRGFASGFSSMAFAAGVVVATKSFQSVRDFFGVQYAFWMLSSFTLVLTLFTWVFIPETKNKTFEEIQRSMYGSKHSNENEVEPTNSSKF